MTRVEILEGALAKLQRDGWCGHGSDGVDGNRLCLENAIHFVVGDFQAAEDVFSFLRPFVGRRSLFMWNDEPERTVADVEALLTAAIAIAKDQQASPALAPEGHADEVRV